MLWASVILDTIINKRVGLISGPHIAGFIILYYHILIMFFYVFHNHIKQCIHNLVGTWRTQYAINSSGKLSQGITWPEISGVGAREFTLGAVPASTSVLKDENVSAGTDAAWAVALGINANWDRTMGTLSVWGLYVVPKSLE